MSKIPLHNIFKGLGIENIVLENEEDVKDFKAQLLDLSKRLKLQEQLEKEMQEDPFAETGETEEKEKTSFAEEDINVEDYEQYGEEDESDLSAFGEDPTEGVLPNSDFPRMGEE